MLTVVDLKVRIYIGKTKLKYFLRLLNQDKMIKFQMR